MLTDVFGYLGHQVHAVRRREVGTLLQWLDRELPGKTLLDVAGGDGYWARQAGRRAAKAVCLDLNSGKLARGRRFRHAPGLVRGDALQLPFHDRSFDIVMSISSIEHFTDAATALDEMSRVLKPGGHLAITADALTRSKEWPSLAARHARRYHVVHPLDHVELTRMMTDRGLEVVRHEYQFRSRRAERLYFALSRFRLALNLALPLAPLVRRWDRTDANQQGSVVLVQARRPLDG